MSDIECKVNEATPLIVGEEEMPSTSSFFSTPVKVAMTIGATLALGAVAVLSYDKTSAMPAMSATTSLKHVFDNEDFAMCPNHYVMGLTPRVASDGCAIISQQDLFDKDADKIVAYTVTVCTNGPKYLNLNYDTLVAMGFTPNKKGDIGLSSISLGRNVTSMLYSGKNFDGVSKLTGSGPIRLTATKFPDQDMLTNDEVNSITIISKTNGDVWAGRGCGITFSVCPAVVSAQTAKTPTEPGCVIVAGHDPNSPAYMNSDLKVVRFCAANGLPTTTITRKNLQALELVSTWGDWDSHISYMNKGSALYTVFYEGPDADTRISGINTGSGSLVHMRYHNGHGCNDNVYSIDMNGGDPKIPVGCNIEENSSDDPAHLTA